jgi:hypothetical protein
MATAYKTIEKRVVGDDWNFDITVTQTDAFGTVTPLAGLTNATIISTFKHRDTGVQIWQGTKAGGQITITNDAAGQIKVSVPRANTATFPLMLLNGDVEVTTSGGVRVTPIRFMVDVLAGYS